MPPVQLPCPHASPSHPALGIHCTPLRSHQSPREGRRAKQDVGFPALLHFTAASTHCVCHPLQHLPPPLSYPAHMPHLKAFTGIAGILAQCCASLCGTANNGTGVLMAALSLRWHSCCGARVGAVVKNRTAPCPGYTFPFFFSSPHFCNLQIKTLKTPMKRKKPFCTNSWTHLKRAGFFLGGGVCDFFRPIW